MSAIHDTNCSRPLNDWRAPNFWPWEPSCMLGDFPIAKETEPPLCSEKRNRRERGEEQIKDNMYPQPGGDRGGIPERRPHVKGTGNPGEKRPAVERFGGAPCLVCVLLRRPPGFLGLEAKRHLRGPLRSFPASANAKAEFRNPPLLPSPAPHTETRRKTPEAAPCVSPAY